MKSKKYSRRLSCSSAMETLTRLLGKQCYQLDIANLPLDQLNKPGGRRNRQKNQLESRVATQSCLSSAPSISTLHTSGVGVVL